ncbi:MAG: hypothetical protein ACTSQS_05735 [Promethearchaeota archaeon]
MVEEINTDYIGIIFRDDTSYVIFNFIDLWHYLESIFEENNIIIEKNEFENLKKEIVSNIDSSIKCYYENREFYIVKDILEIKTIALYYDEDINLEDYEDDLSDFNFDDYLLEDNGPIIIDYITCFNDNVLYIYSKKNKYQPIDDDYNHLIIKLPSIISSEFQIQNYCHIFCKLSILFVIFEYLMKDNMTTHIYQRFNFKDMKINTILKRLKGSVQINKINDIKTEKSLYFSEDYSQSDVFINKLLVKIYNIRNKIFHQAYPKNFTRPSNFSYKEIIKMFEILCKNYKAFFDFLEKCEMRENITN